MRLYLSNHLDTLLSHLQENLPVGLSSGHLLVVPSASIERWVRENIAASQGICAHFTSLFLNETTLRLHQEVLLSPLDLRLNEEWMALALEEIISTQVAQSNNPLFAPLTQYLEGKEGRVMPLSLKLASLFREYFLYDENQETALWETSPGVWQQGLWQLLSQKALQAQAAVTKSDNSIKSVHLFSFSHLSPFHFTFFQKIARHLPISLYHLSPTFHFWSDFKGDRQIQWQERQKKLSLEWEHYFEEQHPVLANLGTLAKEFAKKIESSEIETMEDYQEIASTTTLQQLQQEMLHLEGGPPLTRDESITLHSYSSLFSELEGLALTVRALFATTSIEPKDILIAAPDMGLYRHWIPSLFKEIPWRLETSLGQGPWAAGVKLLLGLPKKRWSAKAVGELFSHPLFKERQGFDDADLAQMEAWVIQANICWGFDERGVHTILNSSDLKDPPMTWKEGLSRLIVQLVQNIDLTELPLLETRR